MTFEDRLIRVMTWLHAAVLGPLVALLLMPIALRIALQLVRVWYGTEWAYWRGRLPAAPPEPRAGFVQAPAPAASSMPPPEG